jgi:hypothetical protein
MGAAGLPPVLVSTVGKRNLGRSHHHLFESARLHDCNTAPHFRPSHRCVDVDLRSDCIPDARRAQQTQALGVCRLERPGGGVPRTRAGRAHRQLWSGAASCGRAGRGDHNLRPPRPEFLSSTETHRQARVAGYVSTRGGGAGGALGPAHGKPVHPHGAVAAARAATLSKSVAGLFSLASVGPTERVHFVPNRGKLCFKNECCYYLFIRFPYTCTRPTASIKYFYTKYIYQRCYDCTALVHLLVRVYRV